MLVSVKNPKNALLTTDSLIKYVDVNVLSKNVPEAKNLIKDLVLVPVRRDVLVDKF